jgi:hypothetical protein
MGWLFHGVFMYSSVYNYSPDLSKILFLNHLTSSATAPSAPVILLDIYTDTVPIYFYISSGPSYQGRGRVNGQYVSDSNYPNL